MSDLNTIENLIKKRRTPNPALFLDKAVPTDILKKCIDLSRYAPNHKRTEPTRFYLASSEQKAALGDLFFEHLLTSKGEQEIELANKKKKVWSSAPALVVVTNYSPKESKLALKMPEIHKEDYATSAVIIQNLSLLLLKKELHTKWSTAAIKNKEEFRQIMKLDPNPETEEVVGILLIGYLPDDFSFIPRPLKPLDEVLRS